MDKPIRKTYKIGQQSIWDLMTNHDLIKNRIIINGPTTMQVIVNNVQDNAKAKMVKCLQPATNITFFPLFFTQLNRRHTRDHYKQKTGKKEEKRREGKRNYFVSPERQQVNEIRK